MLLFALLCLLVGGVAAFAYSRARANPGQALGAAKKLQALQEAKEQSEDQSEPIEKIQPGGVLQLQNVGLRSETIDAQVTARHLHKAGSARWVELEADSGTGKIYITVQRTDELEIGVSLIELSLEELGVDAGQLTGSDSGLAELTHEGTNYCLEEQGRAQFCPNGNELEAEPYQYWEYAAEGDDYQTLALVKWQDGSTQGFYGVNLEPASVTVFSTS